MTLDWACVFVPVLQEQNVLIFSDVKQLSRFCSLLPEASERGNSLMGKKLHYRGIQSLFLTKRKELWLSANGRFRMRSRFARNCGYAWLCWNGRFRMRSGLPRAFFSSWHLWTMGNEFIFRFSRRSWGRDAWQTPHFYLFISSIPKYNNYNNYNNYHISHMHTPTKHLSTNAIIQSLHMISLFKAMPAVILQVLYKKRRN